MKKWEYEALLLSKKIFSSGFREEEEMNTMGKEGWELVSVIPQHAQIGLTGATTGGIAFFKRELK